MKHTEVASPRVAQINVRIDRSLKDEGDAVLAEAGISPTRIVRDLWAKLAQRGTALDEVVAALGASGFTPDEQAAIDAKLAVIDRVSRRRDQLAGQLGLSSATEPLYQDGFEWRDRVRAERDRKRGRRGL